MRCPDTHQAKILYWKVFLQRRSQDFSKGTSNLIIASFSPPVAGCLSVAKGDHVNPRTCLATPPSCNSAQFWLSSDIKFSPLCHKQVIILHKINFQNTITQINYTYELDPILQLGLINLIINWELHVELIWLVMPQAAQMLNIGHKTIGNCVTNLVVSCYKGL